MAMSNDRLALLKLFTRIAITGSLTQAARDLGISTPTASRWLRDLESLLAVQLFDRDTHVLRVTNAGRDFLDRAEELLGGWDRLLDAAGASQTRPARLGVIAPIGLGQGLMLSSLATFTARHSHVSLHWECRDGDVTLLETEADLWIALGRPTHPSLIYRPTGSAAVSLVATPQFVDRHPFEEPADLDRHPGVHAHGWVDEAIVLLEENGEGRHVVHALPRFRSNSPFAVRQAALQGMGWAAIPRFLIEEDLVAGSLVEVLPSWHVTGPEVSIVSVQSRYRLAIVGELVETLATGLRRQLTPDQRPM